MMYYLKYQKQAVVEPFPLKAFLQLEHLLDRGETTVTYGNAHCRLGCLGSQCIH